MDIVMLWSEEEILKAPSSGIGTFHSCQPSLRFYPGDPRRGAVIICPGGGYCHKAPHESEPVALRLNQAGLNAYVLDYRVAPDRYPAPVCDGLRAIATARRQGCADQRHNGRIAILGFSAGGHLAAACGTLCEQPDETPDALILCYPVISFEKFGHIGSRNNLLGEDASPSQASGLSLQNRVTRRTPPAFIWHTADDAGVPVENSLMFAAALSAREIPFALRVYPHGRHGLGLADDDPALRAWADDAIAFLGDLRF